MTTAFPTDEMELTHILVVADLDRARTFYRDVLGAEVYREYGGSSCVLRAFGSWLLLVTGGEPTADKPTVTFAPPTDPDTVAHSMTIRVADCRGAYATLTDRGATFLTPPVESDWEIRAFFRDPDGHLIEISEARSGGQA
ncbi:MAG TPA: VOC family protein [Candidatus Limnocylindrales bacterium]